MVCRTIPATLYLSPSLRINLNEAQPRSGGKFHPPIAAREWTHSLYAAGDSLITFPKRGRKGWIEGTRELMAVYPYVIPDRFQPVDAI